MNAAAKAGFVLAALCNCDGLRLFIGLVLFELLLTEWLFRFDVEDDDDDDEDEQDDDKEVGDEVDDEATDDDALFAIKCVLTLGELGE